MKGCNIYCMYVLCRIDVGSYGHICVFVFVYTGCQQGRHSTVDPKDRLPPNPPPAAQEAAKVSNTLTKGRCPGGSEVGDGESQGSVDRNRL